MADLRYPIGSFDASPRAYSATERATAIRTLAELPARLRLAVSGLTETQIDTPYRPGGWTVRQVVHHTADSHLNAYLRLKFALTEDNPTIKPYAEAVWAELADSTTLPVSVSLDLLESLHARMVTVFRSLPDETFSRTFLHPERGAMTIDDLLALYDWHSKHHTAHVTSLREREGW